MLLCYISVTLWSVLEESKVCSAESLTDETVEHTLVYSMNKVSGRTALTTSTLKSLGLTCGSGLMR